MSAMTKTERRELSALVRKRAKVAKDRAAQLRAERMAHVEAQLARIYTCDDDATIRELHDFAAGAVAEAQTRLAERCDELGIPQNFAPRLVLNWYGRGENMLASRRAELRKVASTRLDALEKAARTEIEAASVRVQTELVADGLTSDAAKAFLEAMPTAETLIPTLAIEEVHGLLEAGG